MTGGTVRRLLRRLWTLLALTVATGGVVLGAYEGVNGGALPLERGTAPAVLALGTAEDALRQSRADAARGADGTSAFQVDMSVVNQSLATVAAKDVDGLEGQRTLKTVDGLLGNYTTWVERATGESDALLRGVYLGYADSVLGVHGNAETSIIGRLDALQEGQRDVVADQTDFGPPMWLAWTAALALSLALAALLVETQVFLRRSFRRRWNRPLACATVLLVAGVCVLVSFTLRASDGLHRSRSALAGDLTGDSINDASSDVLRLLQGAGYRAAAEEWIVAGAVVLLALVVAGLLPRINEYGFRERR